MHSYLSIYLHHTVEGESSPAVGPGGERRRRRPSLVRDKAVGGSGSGTSGVAGSSTTSGLGAKSRLA